MLRSFFLKALLFTALILLLVNVTVGPALAQQVNQGLNTSSSTQKLERNRTRPTADRDESTTRNNRRQEPATSVRSSNDSRPQDPYEPYYDAMKKFNEEVYGKKG